MRYIAEYIHYSKKVNSIMTTCQIFGSIRLHSVSIIVELVMLCNDDVDSPIVGIVVTISPSLSLYRIVVLPAASSPTGNGMNFT